MDQQQSAAYLDGYARGLRGEHTKLTEVSNDFKAGAALGWHIGQVAYSLGYEGEQAKEFGQGYLAGFLKSHTAQKG